DISLKKEKEDLLKKIEELEKENSKLKKIRNKYLAHSDTNEKISNIEFLNEEDIICEHKKFKSIIDDLDKFIKEIEKFYMLKGYFINKKIDIAPTYKSKLGFEGAVNDFIKLIEKLK
ncbi:MAG: hypothetical protein NZ866_03030, partial [Patescibacteria group bacterium]|nr:hypothetical protein [Patescibacteria group bacterium]